MAARAPATQPTWVCTSNGHRISPVPVARAYRESVYWTVIVPFMPIAMCGVQLYSYLPGFTFANEIV